MPKSRMLEGKLIERQDTSDECWTTPKAFIKMLREKVGIEFPVKPGEDFIVYGFQTPGEDQKGKIWAKSDRQGHFAGYFWFVDGKWQRIYNHSNFDVVWKYGDSRVIEDGFALIDGSLPMIDVATQQHIMGAYRLDPVESTFLQPVFTYFATVYLGV